MIVLKIKELMQTKGMTPADLAEAANLSKPTVGSLLSGMSTRIEFETLEKLCNALGAEPGDIIKKE